MTEPTITCPGCKREIKLTESLAAPLIESTRASYEKKLAQKDADVAAHEATLKQREAAVALEKQSLDEQVAEKLKLERAKISSDEARKAKLAVAAEFELRTKAVAELEERVKTQDAKLAESQKSQAELMRQKRELDEAQREMELTIETRIQQSLSATREQTKKEVEAALALKVQEKDGEIAGMQAKLAEAQKEQAELIRKSRELDDAKREMDLTIEKRVQESLSTARNQGKKDAEEQLSLKLLERDAIIESMRKQVEDLKRKAEQGSQQAQGEALEVQLETLLSGKFPLDTLEPVPKGEHGGDILHRVAMPGGSCCGTILWETKRTKNWVDGWLPKLRDDQRAAKAEIAVIVSANLPKGVETFDQVDGVWITHPRAVLPVALSLRQMLIEVGCARQATEGQQTKMELVYQYLTGPKFRLRVNAIVEAFSTMSEDLQKEKKVIMKQWSKREEQINRVMEATVGMYGELQGIAGKTLQEIDGLDMKQLEESPATVA